MSATHFPGQAKATEQVDESFWFFLKKKSKKEISEIRLLLTSQKIALSVWTKENYFCLDYFFLSSKMTQFWLITQSLFVKNCSLNWIRANQIIFAGHSIWLMKTWHANDLCWMFLSSIMRTTVDINLAACLNPYIVWCILESLGPYSRSEIDFQNFFLRKTEKLMHPPLVSYLRDMSWNLFSRSQRYFWIPMM